MLELQCPNSTSELLVPMELLNDFCMSTFSVVICWQGFRDECSVCVKSNVCLMSLMSIFGALKSFGALQEDAGACCSISAEGYCERRRETGHSGWASESEGVLRSMGENRGRW